jgi:hypothetical protein
MNWCGQHKYIYNFEHGFKLMAKENISIDVEEKIRRPGKGYVGWIYQLIPHLVINR